MKKIMFKDKYSLTQAVLDGRKTMTRRIVPKKVISSSKVYVQLRDKGDNINDLRIEFIKQKSPYKIGEVLAITQSYRQIEKEIEKKGYPLDLKREKKICAGYTNKMFVRAEDMPHHIIITDIRVERLQDIIEEDCLCEGIDEDFYVLGERYCIPFYNFKNSKTDGFGTPHLAFETLIDKISGKGTWESNPLVWVYKFELVN